MKIAVAGTGYVGLSIAHFVEPEPSGDGRRHYPRESGDDQ